MERTCELIKQAKEGNKEAQSILVEENSGLIWSVVKRFQGRGYDKEDLFQIGSIGLLKCIENFDLERNVKIERNNELLQKIGDLSNKIDIEDKQIEDELKDSLSYLKIKLEMANGGSLTPDIFFNRLQSSLKNGSKIERNEELIAYQTIKDELNISKK